MVQTNSTDSDITLGSGWCDLALKDAEADDVAQGIMAFKSLLIGTVTRMPLPHSFHVTTAFGIDIYVANQGTSIRPSAGDSFVPAWSIPPATVKERTEYVTKAISSFLLRLLLSGRSAGGWMMGVRRMRGEEGE
eukprot:3592738-Pyramimonas_sp.AAC.1